MAFILLLQFLWQSEDAGKGQWESVPSAQQRWGSRVRRGHMQASALWGQSSHTGPDNASGGPHVLRSLDFGSCQAEVPRGLPRLLVLGL